MGLFDKVKNILFDEEPDDVFEDLPKREPKKSKKIGFKSVPEEDTIKEVKVPVSDKKDDFESFDFEKNSRTKMREEEYSTPVQREVPEESVRPRVEMPQERQPERREMVDRRELEQRRQVLERPQVQSQPVRPESTASKPVSRSRYELPPRKEVHREEKDYKKILSENSNSKIRKPFTVTPIISPVYGIIDKNYKPEEIIEKNKIEPTYENVRERMIGPVSYADQELPEPMKYEASDETLTDKLRKESKIKDQEQEEIISRGVEEEFETREFDQIQDNEPVYEENPVREEKDERPSVDISDLIEETRTNNYEDDYDERPSYNEKPSYNDDENKYVAEPSYEEVEEQEDAPRYEDTPVYKTEKRNDEVKESLDDTIETDLFNLIDSMYNTDERE